MKMKIYLLIFCALTLLLFFMACEDSTGNNNPPPGKVILVEKSAEDAIVETGIDAEYDRSKDRDGIFLQWYSVKDEDLAAYDIYRSAVDSSSAFKRIATIPKVLNNIDTFYVDNSAEVYPQNGLPASRYYYYVVARDEEGAIGERSRVDNYKLEEYSVLNAPDDHTEFDSTFQWTFPVPPDSFIFRIMRLGEPAPFFIKKHQNTYNPIQDWTMFELGLNSLEVGYYLWRIDIFTPEENNGSESPWLSFQVQ